MTNINRMVLDLSHHETVESFELARAAGIYGIIYKATQGGGFKDDTYWQRREGAIAAGMLWGSYHFGDGSDVERQVENYLVYAKPGYDELICLDLEDYKSQMSLQSARAWVEGVEGALQRVGQCVVYSGNTIKEMLGDRLDPFWGARRLWLAQYGSDPKVQKSWDTWWLWQYTDGDYGPEPHVVPGIDKGHGVDSNSFAGTFEDLKDEWSGGAEITPAPQVEVKITVEAPPGVKVTVIGA